MNTRFKEFIHPNVFNFSLTFCVAGLLWLRDIIITPESPLLLHFYTVELFPGYYSAWMGLIINLGIAYLLFRMLEKFTFIQQRTFLPFLFFILLAGAYPYLHIPNNGIIATFCLIISIWQIFSAFHKNIPIREAFNAGLFLAVGYFFCFEFIFIIPVLFITLYIVNNLSLRVILAVLAGILVPVMLAFGLSFWFGQLQVQTDYFIKNISFDFSNWASNIGLIISLGIFTLISLLIFLGCLRNRFQSSNAERKNQQVLFFFYIVLLAILWVRLENFVDILPSFLMICSLLFSIFYSTQSSKFGTTLLFCLIAFQTVTLILCYNGILI
jgi:hypothetical protein